MSIATEAAKLRAKAAKFETATAHLVSELVTHIETLIEEIEHGNQHQAEPQGTPAQEAGRAAGAEDSSGQAGSGLKVEKSSTP